MAKTKITEFEKWWDSDGKYFDPDTEDVSWYDKRAELAEYAWHRGRAKLSVELEELRARQNGWIDVKDRLPEPGREVLAWTKEAVYFLACHSSDGKWYIDSEESCGNVTHWMALPSAPGAEPARATFQYCSLHNVGGEVPCPFCVTAPPELCPSCQASDNNAYVDANGISMRACGRCMIQWKAHLGPTPK